jgi:hypothetical protein
MNSAANNRGALSERDNKTEYMRGFPERNGNGSVGGPGNFLP